MRCFPAAELLLDAERSADRALMAAELAFTEAWRSFKASVLAIMAAVMVAREALRSLVQGEAEGGLVVVLAAAGVGVVAAGAEESRTAHRNDAAMGACGRLVVGSGSGWWWGSAGCGVAAAVVMGIGI